MVSVTMSSMSATLAALMGTFIIAPWAALPVAPAAWAGVNLTGT